MHIVAYLSLLFCAASGHAEYAVALSQPHTSCYHCPVDVARAHECRDVEMSRCQIHCKDKKCRKRHRKRCKKGCAKKRHVKHHKCKGRNRCHPKHKMCGKKRCHDVQRFQRAALDISRVRIERCLSYEYGLSCCRDHRRRLQVARRSDANTFHPSHHDYS